VTSCHCDMNNGVSTESTRWHAAVVAEQDI
jgi:hypothetical protein